MKMSEVKEMNDAEISKRIEEEEKNLVDLKFQHAIKNLTNTAKLRNVRQDIARLKTELVQRKLRSSEA